MSQKIRLVCFDVGGVLVRHCRTWQEGCAAAGLPVRASSDSPEASAARRAIAAKFVTGKIEPQEFYEEMSRASGGLYTPEEIDLIHAAWLGEEYEGVAEVVRRLVERARVRTGVLSNTNRAHWDRQCGGLECAERYPSIALLENRHASHLLGLAKPDAAIFAEFEKRVGVRGEEILFLDDLAENAATARRLGWNVCEIDYTRGTARQIEQALSSQGFI